MNEEYIEYKEKAKNGTLPVRFDQWELADDKHGKSIGHWAAVYGRLPATFSRWDIANNAEKWSVAHEAVTFRNLPDSFDRWGLASVGMSVLKYFLAQKDSFSCDKFMLRWQEEAPLCKTEADWAVFKVELPEIYSKYAIVELFDNTTSAIDDEYQLL
jgi:hypothetical protein